VTPRSLPEVAVGEQNKIIKIKNFCLMKLKRWMGNQLVEFFIYLKEKIRSKKEGAKEKSSSFPKTLKEEEEERRREEEERKREKKKREEKRREK